MNQEAQRIALPAYLARRLQAFREGQGTEQRYTIIDPGKGKTFQLEPWQFFILEILPGCEDFSKLASIFEDRFGSPIEKDKVDELFSTIARDGLFGISAIKHPMLSSYAEKYLIQFDGKAQGATGAAETPQPGQISPVASKPETKDSQQSAKTVAADDGPLPAGVQDVLGLDETKRRRPMLELFDPRPMLRLLQPLLFPFRYTVYLLPILLFGGVFTSIRYEDLIKQDLTRLLGGITFFEHALFGMLTVNLSETLLTALVAHTYRATVGSIVIVFVMGIFPRFFARVGHAKQLSRRERMWLHGSNLLLRMALFSIGIFIWYGTREMNGYLAQFGLALALVSSVSFFLFTANPFVRSRGYFLLATFLDEPNLRAKSIQAFFNKLKGNVYSKTDNNVLVAFAVASFAFTFLFVVVIMLIAYRALKVPLGGAGIIITVLLGIYLLQRLIVNFKNMERRYERSVQFDRWRKQKLPEELEEIVAKDSPKTFKTYVKRALAISLLIVIFVPYPYEPGGQFVILPNMQQVVAADEAGIVSDVYFDGGEELKKGTVIARLEDADFAAQVRIYNARMIEQQSVINELVARPKPEQVEQAERALAVGLKQSEFSKGKAERIKLLYKDGAVSFEEYDQAEKQNQVDIEQVAEKRAHLAVVKAGAPPDEIAAAKAKLSVLQEERDHYQEKIDRSVLSMPFDGTLVTLHLKQKIGSYIGKGIPFAVVEKNDQVIAEIEVAESDIGYVTKSAKVSAVPVAYFEDVATGVVSIIGSDVTVKPFGKVIKVDAILDNKDRKIKTGMSGYAKIQSKTLPVWKVFSLAIARFFEVEVWSWIP